MSTTRQAGKLKTGCGNIYITINNHDGQPFEVFSVMGKSGGCAASYSEAIARLISLALRSGVEPKAIIKHLRGIACHSIAWHEGDKILSCADGINSIRNPTSADITPFTLEAA